MTKLMIPALAAVAVLCGSLSARAEWSESYFTDQYAGSSEETAYAEGLKSASLAGLRARALGLGTELTVACATGGALTALSGVVESIPIIGAIPKMITNYPEPAGLDSAAGGFAPLTGGVIAAGFSTLDLPLEFLEHGRIESPYLMTRAAYYGTAGTAADFLSRDSVCVRSLDKLRDIAKELRARQHSKAKVAEDASAKRVSVAEAGAGAPAAERGSIAAAH